MSTFDFDFPVNLENWTYSTYCFSLAILPNSYLLDSESTWQFCNILLKEVYVLEQLTTFEEKKKSQCSVWMLRVTLTYILVRLSSVQFDVYSLKRYNTGIFLRRMSVITVIISSEKLSRR